MDLLEGDDIALPHVLLQCSLFAVTPGALVAHESSGVPRGEHAGPVVLNGPPRCLGAVKPATLPPRCPRRAPGTE
eukprot:4323714-Pyramimonas_sp.AAC.1